MSSLYLDSTTNINIAGLDCWGDGITLQILPSRSLHGKHWKTNMERETKSFWKMIFLFQRVNVQLRDQCSLFADLEGTFTYMASRDVDTLRIMFPETLTPTEHLAMGAMGLAFQTVLTGGCALAKENGRGSQRWRCPKWGYPQIIQVMNGFFSIVVYWNPLWQLGIPHDLRKPQDQSIEAEERSSDPNIWLVVWNIF